MFNHFLKKTIVTILLTLFIVPSVIIDAYGLNSPVIYFHNWSEYISDDILAQFTKETGIKVIFSTYESNEVLYAQLKTYPCSSYDLIVPSTYFISKMRSEHMLQKIDKSQLSNFNQLDPLLLDKPFDPHNDYSIPYLWGITGIGINTDQINPKNIHSWADLWEGKYRNSLLVIDDARELFHIALLKLGFSPNTTDPQEILSAYRELRRLLPNILLFNSDSPAMPFITGEVNIGMLWNGAAYNARQAMIPLHMIWPKEGAIFWMDSLAIPKGARNTKNALKLIDFLLRPDIAAKISQKTGYTTPNQGAKILLPKEMLKDPLLYPNLDLMKKGEWQISVGDNCKLYEEYFQKLKWSLH